MIAQFALRLICGMSLIWAFMPRAQVTSGFFRIQMLVTLGLSVLAALMVGQAEPREADLLASQRTLVALCAALAVASFLGSVLWTLHRRRAGTALVFFVAALSAVTLLLMRATASSLHSMAGGLALASELAAAVLLGGAMVGMLLGHWYLTAPTMSIAPLSRVNRDFGLAAVARLLLAAATLALAWNSIDSGTHWLWLGLRWIAGLAGPLAVAAMVAQILRYRNTQAATGVLFVGVILTFIGEMTAALLDRDLGWPL